MASIHSLALTIAGVILIPAIMNAQVDRTRAPKPAPAPKVNLGAHETFLLPNGMRAIVVENHKLPLVSVQVKFDIAPVLQGDIAGYQDLVGELFGAGTVRRKKQRLDEQVDALGASLSTFNDGLYASSLKKNFPALMEIVQEVVKFPAFPDDEFEKARTRMISSVRTRVDDPDQIADAVARVLIYGKSHPYGEIPTEASLAKVQRSNVIAYYQRFFQPGSAYIVFVGDITTAEAKALCDSYFSDWKGAEVKSTNENGVEVVEGLGPIRIGGDRPRAQQDRTICFVDRPGSAQSVVKFCSPVSLKPNSPDALDAQVMNTILGGGVFNARLMQNLREDKAYTYGAYSSLSADRYIGSWTGGCSVRNAVTDSTVNEIIYEMKRMQEEPVTDAELSLAKSYMAGSFARSLEDPSTLARFALNTYINELRPDHYTTYLQRLDSVDVAAVQAAANRYLSPDHGAVLVVGDKAEVGNKLAPYSVENAVIYYDVNGDLYRELAEPAPAGMKASDVIDTYVNAIGGRSAIDKVKNMSRSYAATAQGMEVVLSEYNMVPGHYAMEMMVGPMTMQKMVYANGRGYRQDMEGRTELLDIELADARENSYPFPEAYYQTLDYEMHLTGVVPIDGRKTYRINVSKENGVFTEYYDVETGLKVRRSQPEATPQGTFDIITDFSDYREVGGVKVAHTIKQNAGMNFEFKAKEIKVNEGVDPSLFRID
jgi:predicted Zn-dependent peptidase